MKYTRLRKDGVAVNYKRLWRIQRAQRLQVSLVEEPNQCWSMNFMSEASTYERRFRTLNVLEDWNREVFSIKVNFSTACQSRRALAYPTGGAHGPLARL